jgi:hypothetical protein
MLIMPINGSICPFASMVWIMSRQERNFMQTDAKGVMQPVVSFDIYWEGGYYATEVFRNPNFAMHRINSRTLHIPITLGRQEID